MLFDLDDDVYELLLVLARDHGWSVTEEISSLLSEAAWREQATAAIAGRLTDLGTTPG